MGYGKWSDDAYTHLKKDYSTKSTADIFTSRSLTNDMDPKGVAFREARDSDDHPLSTPIMLMLDVTGSMGRIPDVLVRDKLGALMQTLLDHDIQDPQVLFGAIGDHHCDSSPLQVGQFESSTELLNKWLTEVYLEGGGGGQNMESYLLAWLFAARHTTLDSFEKRGKKGFLFTMGDEWTWDKVAGNRLCELMGYESSEGITAEGILEEAKRQYHVFHIHINETGYRDDPSVIEPWKNLMGERFILLDDHTTVAETIATTVAVISGAELSHVTSSFDPAIASTVSKALINIKTDITTTANAGITTL